MYLAGLHSAAVVGKGDSARPIVDRLFSRMATPPASLRRAQIYTLVSDLMAAGAWRLIDGLYTLGAADTQASRLNLVSDAYNLTAYNSPIFTVDRGYTGDGVSSYLDTGADMSALANYKLNSACMFMWQLTAAQVAVQAVSSTTTQAFISARTGANKTYVRINDGGSGTAAINVASTDGSGFWAVDRDSAASRALYKSGVQIGADTQVSSAASGTPMILRANTSYSNAQVAVFGFGAHMPPAVHLAMYNAIHKYMTAIGAAA